MRLPVENYNLPSDWKVSPVSEVADFSRGVSWGKAEETSKGEGLLVVSIPNIKDGWIDYNSKFNHYLLKEVNQVKRLNVGDIVFVGSSGSIQNVGRNARVSSVPNGSVAFASFTFKAVPKSNVIDGDFFYYLINSDLVPFPLFCKRAADGKFNFQLRDFANRLAIPLPPLPEQRKIAHILSTVQRAIEAQERIIQTTIELKKALMHKLFTEGLRHEPQQQTEIGPVPESWEVVELGTLFAKQPQNGLYKPKKDYGTGTQILRIDDFSNEGDIVTSAGNLVALECSEIETYGLEPGDIVINRVNSLSHLGKTALIGDTTGEMVFESNMMRFSVDASQVHKEFVFKYLNSPLTKSQIIGTAKRAVAQSSINQGDVKAIIVPMPTLEEQSEIVAALDATEAKIAHGSVKATVLQDLLRTLVHELMTAKTRVHELEISA
jgi:type I restriction enzyme S subunit